MTVRKPASGKNARKKLKVKKQTMKDLDPKSAKVAGGGSWPVYCGAPAKPTMYMCTIYTVRCGTEMTRCGQITCA